MRKYNTHRGLYQYNGLPFGVASISTCLMEKILQSIPKVVVYILVTGKNEEEHLTNLREVLGRLKEHGIRPKQCKCRFMANSVEYLGYRIDKDGLHALPEKVAAIVDAPQPNNATELRAFGELLWKVYQAIIHPYIPTKPAAM